MLKKDRELLKQIAGNMEASQSEIKTLVETLVALSEKSENEKNEATQVNTEQVVEALKILAEKSENNGLKDYSETSQLNNEKMVSMLNKLIEATENNGIKELTQASQEGIKTLTEAMEKQTTRMLPQTIKENEFTDNEKLVAAYALNLCTVSISQIIDYNDIYILEQEYEAILNNLNLEKMPKDEVLLNILKQILDTVTFFRIQEGEKVLQEKRYQHQMKNAIWSAVPNLGVIIASGDPKAMALSLVTQVGAGYMNYRKEKAKIQLEHEEEKWKLQRSAIEQFNGLRRELFDTAWRLADEYGFGDEYRLTERQISQYNAILMDTNSIRRYERLETIKDNFKAYVPFWYYMGKAAYEVYASERTIPEIKEKYKRYAQDCFSEYFKLEKAGCALLRENQITAVCNLEYLSFANCAGIKIEKTEQLQYIKNAIEASGGANDILNICAMEYLKIGEIDKAAGLFRQLVNEDYNTSINTYILSNIYISKYLQTEDKECYTNYKTLQTKLQNTIDAKSLMPWIEKIDDLENESNEYLYEQKYVYARKYVDVLMQIFARYERDFDIISEKVGKYTGGADENFKEHGKDFIKIYNSLVRTVSKIASVWDFKKIDFINTFKLFDNNNVKSKTGQEMQKEYLYVLVVGDFFELLTKKMLDGVKKLKTMSELVNVESKLFDFCDNYGYIFPIINLSNNNNGTTEFDEWFVYSDESQREENKKQVESMKKIVNQYKSDIEKSGQFRVIIEDVEQYVGGLTGKNILQEVFFRQILFGIFGVLHFKTLYKVVPDILTRTSDIIAIIDKVSDGKDNIDLLLTRDGVHIIKGESYCAKYCIKYDKMEEFVKKTYKGNLALHSIMNMFNALTENSNNSDASEDYDINLLDIVDIAFEKFKMKAS